MRAAEESGASGVSGPTARDGHPALATNPWSFIDVPSVRPAGRGVPHPPDQTAILERAAGLDDAVAVLPLDEADGPVGAAVRAAGTPHDLQLLADVVGAPDIPADVLVAARSPVWQDDAGQAITTLALLLANARSGLAGVDPRFLDLTIADIHYAAVYGEQSNILLRRRRRRAVLDSLEAVVAPERVARIRRLSEFTGTLRDFSHRVDALRTALSRIRGLEQEAGWNPLLERDAGRLQTIREWAGWLAHQLDPAISSSTPGFREALGAVYTFRNAPDAILSAKLAFTGSEFDALALLLGESSLSLARRIAPAGGLVEAWRSPARDPRGSGGLLLERWIRLLEQVEPLRAAAPGERAEILRQTSAGVTPI